jgi:hypothetical protein
MATRLKTVKYAFPALASLTNNTLTNLTQLTINLPETTKTFRSVVAHVTMDDIITATGGSLTTKTLALRLGAATYTSIANANTLTNSGENASFWLTADFTSHFTTNWTGTSMTCDFQLQINQSTGTTLGMVNVCVTLDITYAYDDTSATHIKTVMIPLNAPVGAIATTATTYDTIPALDTYLPEASKVYRNIYVVIQGNEARNGATTAHTMTIAVGATSVTTGSYEGSQASDRYFRYVYNLTSTYPSTAATQTFQPTATVARINHFQAYLVVTYEFNPATTTSVLNSVMLPMDLSSPMGGTTSADYQRGSRELWIEEPGTITTNRVAFYPFWQQISNISTLNMRIGTGAFVTYTDAATVLCGANAAMVRNDSAFTLARGRNKLNFDIYRSDTADFGWNLCGFWLVNYTSSLATAGIGAHNHSVEWSIMQNGTGAAASNYTAAATAVAIPETDFHINALGTQLIVMTSGTVAASGYTILVERLAAEGGMEWEAAYIDSSQSDPEIGAFTMYSQMRTLFKRFPGDMDPNRMDIETARRWRVHINGSTAVNGWISMGIMLTYHTITYNVANTITGGFNGTVTVGLHRSEANTSAPGELVKTVTRTGAGAFSFTWYDNTEPMFVTAIDTIGTVGRSQDSLAA